MSKRLIALGTAFLMALLMLMTVNPAPGSASTPLARSRTTRYCNSHHTLKTHYHRSNFRVYVDTQPDAITQPAHVGWYLMYGLCRIPNEKDRIRTYSIGGCAYYDGKIPSIVWNGLLYDTTVSNENGVMNQVNNSYINMHAPVKKGDEHCDQQWFISKAWVPKASLVRYDVHYTEVTGGAQPDQSHNTGKIFLDPKNDKDVNPF